VTLRVATNFPDVPYLFSEAVTAMRSAVEASICFVRDRLISCVRRVSLVMKPRSIVSDALTCRGIRSAQLIDIARFSL
jgi:hypothetical protein